MIFQAGERIRAEIPALTVKRVETDSDGHTWVHLTYDDNAVLLDLALPADTAITWTRVTPADGEPKPGELWADQLGALYLARRAQIGVMLVDADEPGTSGQNRWDDVHRGPTGPIRRVAARPQIGGA